jgi:hypothetical protein
MDQSLNFFICPVFQNHPAHLLDSTHEDHLVDTPLDLVKMDLLLQK